MNSHFLCCLGQTRRLFQAIHAWARYIPKVFRVIQAALSECYCARWSQWQYLEASMRGRVTTGHRDGRNQSTRVISYCATDCMVTVRRVHEEFWQVPIDKVFDSAIGGISHASPCQPRPSSTSLGHLRPASASLGTSRVRLGTSFSFRRIPRLLLMLYQIWLGRPREWYASARLGFGLSRDRVTLCLNWLKFLIYNAILVAEISFCWLPLRPSWLLDQSSLLFCGNLSRSHLGTLEIYRNIIASFLTFFEWSISS